MAEFHMYRIKIEATIVVPAEDGVAAAFKTPAKDALQHLLAQQFNPQGIAVGAVFFDVPPVHTAP